MRARGVGRVVALSLLVVAATSAGAEADTIGLVIQPIQVCDDLGASCANPGRSLFTDATRAIWLQAGIWFTALAWESVWATPLLDTSFTELAAAAPGSGSPGVINVWFVDQISDCGGTGGVYGCAYLPGNGVAIADAAFRDQRLDVLAHELGHNLGLTHVDDPFNLMAYGDLRLVPLALADIYPFGPLDRLDPEQIALARSSPYLVPIPEPASLALVIGGVAALACRRLRLAPGRRRPAAAADRRGD